MTLKRNAKYALFSLIFLFHPQAHSQQTTFFAEFLTWQAREGGDENWSQDISPKAAEQSVTLYDAPFSFSPGFRLGLGHQAPNKAWDLKLYYTYYQTEAENHASGDIYSAYLGNYFANNTNGANFGPFYDSGQVNWTLSYQTVDLELGREFIIDQILTLKPFVGITTALIDQKIDTDWVGPKTTNSFGVTIPITSFSTATENLTQDFWGIGPSLGLESIWPFYQSDNDSLKLIGQLSGALIWGHWSFTDTYQNDTPVKISVNTDSFSGAETVARGLLGVEWVKQLEETQLKLRLNYEAQIWFNQIQFYTLSTGRMNNLMSLQGANLGLYVTF